MLIQARRIPELTVVVHWNEYEGGVVVVEADCSDSVGEALEATRCN